MRPQRIGSPKIANPRRPVRKIRQNPDRNIAAPPPPKDLKQSEPGVLVDIQKGILQAKELVMTTIKDLFS